PPVRPGGIVDRGDPHPISGRQQPGPHQGYAGRNAGRSRGATLHPGHSPVYQARDGGCSGPFPLPVPAPRRHTPHQPTRHLPDLQREVGDPRGTGCRGPSVDRGVGRDFWNQTPAGGGRSISGIL
ncbi:unnamed protein product, partial [Scytosiphon promiscuus]